MNGQLTIMIGNDMLLDVEGLTDEATGQPITGATVQITLKNEAGTDIGSAITLDEIDPAHHRATLPYNLGVTAGEFYKAHITVETDEGGRGAWVRTVQARLRT